MCVCVQHNNFYVLNISRLIRGTIRELNLSRFVAGTIFSMLNISRLIRGKNPELCVCV